jgi:hypothetical protein
VCNEEMHTELTISNFTCITINTFEKNDLWWCTLPYNKPVQKLKCLTLSVSQEKHQNVNLIAFFLLSKNMNLQKKKCQNFEITALTQIMEV